MSCQPGIPVDQTQKHEDALCLLLKINACVGMLMSLIFAVFLAVCACDAPSTPQIYALITFCVVLPVASLVFVVLPLWAACRVSTSRPFGLSAAILHSLVIAPLSPPLGPVLALAQLYFCVRLMIDFHAAQAVAA
jgi:hypothetical protein